MPAQILQAVLSLAALGNALCCYARAERLADGSYVIHRGDVPDRFRASHMRVSVEDSVKSRLMVAGDRCWLKWRDDGTWTVEGRE